MSERKTLNRSHTLVREWALRPTILVLVFSFFIEAVSVTDARFFGLRGGNSSLATWLAFAPTLPARHFFLPWIFSALAHMNWWHFISNAPWFWFVGGQLEQTLSKRNWWASFVGGVLAINAMLILAPRFIGVGGDDLTLGLSAITLCLGLEALIARPRLSLVVFFVLFGIVLASDPTLFGSPLGAAGHGAGLVTGLIWGLLARRGARPQSREGEPFLRHR